MSTALILSGSYLESNRYLQAEGVRGRHATNAGTVASAYFDRIVELPSFANRPDRHAVAQAVRRKTRGRKVKWDVLEEWTPPPKVVEPEPVNVYLFGDLVDVDCSGNGDVPLPAEPADNPNTVQDVVPPAKKTAAKKAAAPRVKTADIDDLFGDA